MDFYVSQIMSLCHYLSQSTRIFTSINTDLQLSVKSSISVVSGKIIDIMISKLFNRLDILVKYGKSVTRVSALLCKKRAVKRSNIIYNVTAR